MVCHVVYTMTRHDMVGSYETDSTIGALLMAIGISYSLLLVSYTVTSILHVKQLEITGMALVQTPEWTTASGFHLNTTLPLHQIQFTDAHLLI